MATHIQPPAGGQKITLDSHGAWLVPDRPVVPFIEGDGVGVDITPAMRAVVDAAVQKAYGGARAIAWMEVFAGEKAARLHGAGNWLPAETLAAMRDCRICIKGPLATPADAQVRSLNVQIRQALDLYVCLRPVRHIPGAPAPLKEPQKVDMAVFRENSEDVYAGIEWPAGSAQAQRLLAFLRDEMGVDNIRHPGSTGIGIKPMSQEGSQRLVRQAIRYAIERGLPSVTLVHKGNIMRCTEGAFRDWGYALARREFGAQPLDGGPWLRLPNPKTGGHITVKDVMADAFLQQVLVRPGGHSVIATPNLNGDYISDMLAAQTGSTGMAPCANLGDGLACFEVTHGVAAKYAGKDYVNPGSLILAAAMMLRHMGWHEAAALIEAAMQAAVQAKTVTYDLARQMQGATQVSCSGFAQALIAHMAAAA